jgi:hypothetical protein
MNVKGIVLFSILISSFCLYSEVNPSFFKALLTRAKNHCQPETQTCVIQASANDIIDEQVILNMICGQSRLDRIEQGISQETLLNLLTGNRVIEGNGIIRGSVYEKDGVTPVKARVTITAFDEYGYMAGISQTDSSTEGRYTISGLSPGAYYVRISSNEYMTQFFQTTPDWQQAVLVELAEGGIVENIDFALDMNDYRAAISGQVFCSETNPIVECNITAIDDNWNTHSAIPEVNGFYLISGLKEGEYRVHLDYWGDGNYVSVWHEDTQSLSSASRFSVSEADTAKNIDFHLEAGGAISGQIFDSSSNPVAAYACGIEFYDREQNYMTTISNTDNGFFILSGLQTGEYIINVRPDQEYVSEWYNDADRFELAERVPVNAPDTTKNIRVYLNKGGTLSGQLIDSGGQPLQNNDWMVFIEPIDNADFGRSGSRIGRNGQYKFEGLANGRYRLFAQNMDRADNPTGEELANEWYDGVYRSDEATLVQVSPPNETKNINFTLERGGYISGRILGPNGLFSLNATISAYNGEDQIIQQTETLGQNKYNLVGLTTGEYRLKISLSPPERGIYYEEWYDAAYNFEAAAHVQVIAGQGTHNIDFTLEEINFLKGLIKDTDGYPAYGENEPELIVYVYDAETGMGFESETATFTGGYHFQVLSGTYKLAAMSYFSNLLNCHSDLGITYYPNGKYFDDGNTQGISIKDGSTLQLLNIIMDRVSGGISGAINKWDGPFSTTSSYLVGAVLEDGYLAGISLYIGAYGLVSGDYTITGLRPGRYFLFVTVGTAFLEDGVCQWYGCDTMIAPIEGFGKIDIPDYAVPIAVENEIVTGIDIDFQNTGIHSKDGNLPNYYMIRNYPNPFNPMTTINYSIHQKSLVELKIYNLSGQCISTLVNEEQMPGNYKIIFDGTEYPTGIYFYRLINNMKTECKKMLLIK